jgi:hypothetical protein
VIDKGTKIQMKKGYKGMKGIIVDTTDSPYEFYVIRLEKGIIIIAGPSAFIPDQGMG